jgi:hypothetical protein
MYVFDAHVTLITLTKDFSRDLKIECQLTSRNQTNQSVYNVAMVHGKGDIDVGFVLASNSESYFVHSRNNHPRPRRPDAVDQYF